MIAAYGSRRIVVCLLSWLLGGAVLMAVGSFLPEGEGGGTLLWSENFDGEDAEFEDGRIVRDHEWWIEGGERAYIQAGRLFVEADPAAGASGQVATVWCRTPVSGDVRIEAKAHVVGSSIGANNINLFFFYSDPEGRPLFETRGDRADAAYRRYHDLNGYIVTFLRDHQEEFGLTESGHPHARFRLRRCPGFELVSETYDPMGVHAGQTYNLTIIRRGGVITFAVDGKEYLQWEDEEPLREGLFGLRTFRTDLWWDDVRVYRIESD